ncbi:MAG TPA: hypothetical protein VK486_14095 [Thermoleophilaceae bacterium]|nr:hypothetical protein [Thermoleophilaceae bacterium]
MTAKVAGTPRSITNTATVTADQRDADVTDNSATATVTVPPSPSPPAPPQPRARSFDLLVSKTTNDRQVSVGQPVTYKIVVTNRGPAAAPGVKMTDTLNAPVSVRSVKTTAGTCSQRIPMRCSLGTIPAGDEVTIKVVARHQRPRCSDRNAASATGEGTDATPASNLDTVRVCTKRIRLRLTKVADRRAAVAGALITYTIRVATSTTTAPDVRTCDRLPAGLVYVSASSKPRLRGGAWCWHAETLAPGKSKRYRITVRALPGAGGTKLNRATTGGRGQVKAAFAERAVRIIRRSAATVGGVTG